MMKLTLSCAPPQKANLHMFGSIIWMVTSHTDDDSYWTTRLLDAGISPTLRPFHAEERVEGSERARVKEKEKSGRVARAERLQLEERKARWRGSMWKPDEASRIVNMSLPPE